MKTSQAGIDLIKRYEGFVSKPYLCPAGVWTVGYGSTRGVTRDTPPVTKEQAEEILRRDVKSAEAAVMRLCPSLKKQNRFDAIVSFTFNLGAGALQRSTLRQKINRKDQRVARPLAQVVEQATACQDHGWLRPYDERRL